MTLKEKVWAWLDAHPGTTNQELHDAFPPDEDEDEQAKKKYLSELKRRYIKARKLKAVMHQMGKQTEGEPVVIPPAVVFPEEKLGRKPKNRAGEVDRETCEMTNRTWRGEEPHVLPNGEIEWAMPANPDKTFAHWFEVFYLNEFNFHKWHPIGEVHREIGAILESGLQQLAIMFSRDHLKTTFITTGYMMNMILERTRIMNWSGILNVSLDDTLAQSTRLSVIENLRSNPYILSFYGYVIDDERPDSQQHTYFKFQPKSGKPGLKTIGFNQRKITGMHPSACFIDDVQDEPFSESAMRKFQRVIGKKLIPALGRHGRLIVTGTYKGNTDENDAYLWLAKMPSFRVFDYPAIVGKKMPPMEHIDWKVTQRAVLDDEGKPILDHKGLPIMEEYIDVTVKYPNRYHPTFPERYTIEDLMRIYINYCRVGREDVYYSEYLLIPTDMRGNYFKKKRVRHMENMPFQEFGDLESMWRYFDKYGVPTYLWIDPGGETGHGIAVVVMAFYKGAFFLLDAMVIHAGIMVATVEVVKLIQKWRVAVWGVEGNFHQKETFGHTMNRLVQGLLHEKGLGHLYSFPRIVSNRVDKYQRIREGIAEMLGIEGMEYTLFINQRCTGYQDVMLQIGSFPEVTGKNHDFDLLDCMVSCKTFLFQKRGKPVVAGNRTYHGSGVLYT